MRFDTERPQLRFHIKLSMESIDLRRELSHIRFISVLLIN